MRKIVLAAPVSFLAIFVLSVALVAQRKETSSFSTSTPILGFAAAHAAAEHKLEAEFQAIPSAEKAREWHRTFTAEPHPAASERNNQLADLIADEWRKQGWEDVALRRYEVLHSRPRSISLEMTAPVHYAASLREDPVDADPATKNPAISGAYFGYSPSGEVSADVVYAHSGNPEDYELLRKHGVSVRGKIVLVRYSNPYSYRGFKALTAEREGAVALLIYSDPAEDGDARGKVFPDGPWGPESHIQRGAITYDYIVPGDPTTPGWASVPGAKHIPPEEAYSLPKIPALPLSWRDAKPLLENMNGAEAPKDWQGALPIKYRLTGAVTAHVKADMDTSLQPYTVVEARIRGSELPDEWVLMGNHRDAWVFGGVDPSSGTASMLELTRALGEMKEHGIRPRRTLVVCSWDGEEYALTGSTEWGEQFADDLKKKLVAYLNVDESVAGAAMTAGPEGLSFSPAAVASLAPMLVEASKDVRAPSGKSLYEAWRATSKRDDKASAPPLDSALVETRIGSGSDHTVFLNHLGRPVINLGFSGDYGVYHSMYDDHYWMENIGDPSFEYHIALTRIWGLVALRLANADVLPYDFGFNAMALEHFLTAMELRNKIDPHKLKLKKLHELIGNLLRAGEGLREAVLHAPAWGGNSAEKEERLNQQLLQVESNWLNPDGIPGRPWFQHLIYASRYTYAHLEFPGLTEAVEKGDWKLASEQELLIERALTKNIELLRNAKASWEKEN
ncbi:MAG TPA: M28 family metallopeptidase [Candidatus Acidoferrum sp.]|nr:M28 family metallopeptidase [Candidatus Acidoferrum sp.]